MTQQEAQRIAEDVASDIIGKDTAARLRQCPEVRKVYGIKLMHELNNAYEALVTGLTAYLVEV